MLNANDLSITGGTSVPRNRLDTQQLSLVGSRLSLTNGGSVSLTTNLDRTLTFDYNKGSGDRTAIINIDAFRVVHGREFSVYNNPTVSGVANRLQSITIANETSDTVYLIGNMQSTANASFSGVVIGKRIVITNTGGVITYTGLSPGKSLNVGTGSPNSYQTLAYNGLAGNLTLSNGDNIPYIVTLARNNLIIPSITSYDILVGRTTSNSDIKTIDGMSFMTSNPTTTFELSWSVVDGANVEIPVTDVLTIWDTGGAVGTKGSLFLGNQVIPLYRSSVAPASAGIDLQTGGKQTLYFKRGALSYKVTIVVGGLSSNNLIEIERHAN